MHPALRKGPLFYTKNPPFSTFFYKKLPTFHFLPTGLNNIGQRFTRIKIGLREKKLKIVKTIQKYNVKYRPKLGMLV